MKIKKNQSNNFFRAVCLCFSLVLLMLLINSHVQLMTVDRELLRLEEELAKAEDEIEILRVRNENRISLEQLENLALNSLGMHRPGVGQVYFGILPG